MSFVRGYEADPCHAVTGMVGAGLGLAVAGLAPGLVLAVDGPAALDWDRLAGQIGDALAVRDLAVKQIDMREHLAPWPHILDLTTSPALPDDPDFAPLAQASLADLFTDLPEPDTNPDAVTIVVGPGAALVTHHTLWYADLPKRYAEAAITAGTGRNLGQPAGTGPATTRRLFYIDWPILDRHRDNLIADIDLWLDTQNPHTPAWLDGPTLRATLADLSTRPFRTRPTFNTTTWGGHWAQQHLGFNPHAPNTALGYELIAPESGILVGTPHNPGDPDSPDGPGDADSVGGADGPPVEIPLQALVARYPEQILGSGVHATFGTSFPIRFDYLDTVGGGNLSVHCHPQPDYMHHVFGWPYTQHETYYMMIGAPDHHVFLGLRHDADLHTFRHEADRAVTDGIPFDIERYVQTFPAEQHQLFLIPAGTPHGSGQGNVVLEISATPYLYSLRFYDWLRTDHHGRQRPVHIEHAFTNLDTYRTGDTIARDLIQQPRTIRTGPGWHEDIIGHLPEMFFEVHRMELGSGATADDTTGGHDGADRRFHILTVVDGDAILLHTEDGHRYLLAYAETLTIPAAVGAYRVNALGTGNVRYVKALVR